MISRTVSSTLTGRYARAFLRVYGTDLRFEDIQRIDAFAYYVRDKKVFFMPHVLSAAQLASACAMLSALAQEQGLPSSVTHLFRLLMEEDRLFLVDLVLRQIVRIYKKQQGIITCTVRSSHPLTEQSRKELGASLAHKTDKQMIIEQYVVDPQLIAGIRVQGETFLWECSLDQRLREARLPFIR